MMTVADIGPAVLDFLFEKLQIDLQWSVREPRGFTWWPHRLAQRVWAEPARQSFDHQIVRVHAVTSLLRNVRETAELRPRLSALNRFTSLGALVWSPERERIFLHCSAVFHAQNVEWLRPIFLAAVGIQATDAHVRVDGLAHIFGGEPEVSAHPNTGPRSDPDDILNVIARVFAPAGAGPSPWTERDFRAVERMAPAPWTLATSDATGLTAEFAFSGPRPAVVAPALETALFTASATDRHPQLGAGLLLRLQLPLSIGASGPDLANMLNTLEMSDDAKGHTLGAWCDAPTAGAVRDAASLTFASFIPAAVYRSGLLEAFALDMALRARWVADVCKEAGLVEAPRRATAPVHQVRCWRCKAPLVVTPETRGKKVKCQQCGTKQELPR